MNNTLLKLEIFEWDCVRVTPSTLFKKREYQGLKNVEQWQKAINNGWRYDMFLNKFYRLVNAN